MANGTRRRRGRVLDVPLPARILNRDDPTDQIARLLQPTVDFTELLRRREALGRQNIELAEAARTSAEARPEPTPTDPRTALVDIILNRQLGPVTGTLQGQQVTLPGASPERLLEIELLRSILPETIAGEATVGAARTRAGATRLDKLQADARNVATQAFGQLDTLFAKLNDPLIPEEEKVGIRQTIGQIGLQSGTLLENIVNQAPEILKPIFDDTLERLFAFSGRLPTPRRDGRQHERPARGRTRKASGRQQPTEPKEPPFEERLVEAILNPQLSEDAPKSIEQVVRRTFGKEPSPEFSQQILNAVSALSLIVQNLLGTQQSETQGR